MIDELKVEIKRARLLLIALKAEQVTLSEKIERDAVALYFNDTILCDLNTQRIRAAQIAARIQQVEQYIDECHREIARYIRLQRKRLAEI